MNKTNFTYPCGQWRYFHGLCERISSFCVVLCGNCACLVARVVSVFVHVDSGFRMSSSTPVHPFKPENPFTPASDSSPDLSVNYFGSSSGRFRSTNPFASQNELDNFPTDLFTHHRKLGILRIMMVLGRYEII